MNEWLKRGKKVVMTCPRIRNVTGNLFKPKKKNKVKIIIIEYFLCNFNESTDSFSNIEKEKTKTNKTYKLENHFFLILYRKKKQQHKVLD